MNLLLWSEVQKASLIDAGVHPHDAERAVSWVVDHLPPGQDPDTWMPAREVVIDAVRAAQRESIVDAKAAWYSDDAVPSRFQNILSAQSVANADEGRDRGAELAGGLLLLYLFLRDERRYYTARPFRPVSDASIRNLLSAHVSSQESAISDLTTGFHDGGIAPAVWLQQMQIQLRRIQMNYRALGAGGYDMMGDGDYLAIDAELMSDYSRLHDFATEIGDMTLPQAQARSQMYVGNARIQFWAALAALVGGSGGATIPLMRRVLRPADHCRSCVEYSARGWQRAGSLPQPGQQSECRTNCRCYVLYTAVPSNELDEWIGTRRNANR